MSRILAIDYGVKRSGIAVTDSSKIIATALQTVETKHLLSFLTEYLSKEEVECVVIGSPLNLHGKEQDIEEQIRYFIVNLKEKFPTLKIERIDERFTSKMAEQIIREAGIGRKKRRNKSLVDKLSATIILQDYLEQKR
jgi:putative Holliday junction resolvase